MPESSQRLECECGVTIEATSDDELVDRVNAHTRAFHNLVLPPEVIRAKARPIA